MRIALDAMGGDHAPEPVVAGAVQAVTEIPGLRVVLVGDRAQIEPALAAAGGQAGDRIDIFPRHSLGRERPTIGLMNVGSEEAKGHELAKDTHALFNSSPLREQFVGNIEGRDIHRGACDVVVTEGFVGNVVLKVCEGVFDFIMKMIVHELHKTLTAERQLAHETLMNLIHTHDYSAYGGAPLLGIDGICIICHGSSGDRAIKNALGVAAKYARAGLNDIIVRELATAPVPGEED